MNKMMELLGLLVFCSLNAAFSPTQGDSFTKNFKQFKDIAKNIDFYAYSSASIVPFGKPVKEAQERLVSFLGNDLAKGAIVICSTLEQRDSVNEARVLKLGYKWVLVQATSEVTVQQRIAQMKAQMGGQLPPGMLERFQNRSAEQKASEEARLVSSTILRMGYAIIMTTLNPEKEFRSSRLDDMGRSPLADWLDVGLASYAAGSASMNIGFLQSHLEEAFPMEDILSMSRPFVAPAETGSGGGGGGQFIVRSGGEGGSGGQSMGGGMGGRDRSGGAPMGGGGGGRGGMNLPKDVQDRMTFDAQAASFFRYAVEKLGLEKAREVIQWNREGKLSRDALFRSGYLGSDVDQVEKDWQEWVKQQKPEGPGNIRIMMGGPQRPSGSPQ